LDSPTPSGATTPKFLEIEPRLGSKLKNGALNPRSPRAASPRKPAVTYDEDIEPDQLLPFFLETKAKLFEIQRPRQDSTRKGAKEKLDATATPEEDLLLAKLDRIEKDILFDKHVAENQWRAMRIVLEKDHAAVKKQKAQEEKSEEETAAGKVNDVNGADVINAEAERIAAEILAENSDDDQGLADMFASLPVNEVDPITGRSSTVMHGSDGTKVTIRDFGKWTGVSPMRALEEACRSRFVTPSALCSLEVNVN